MIEKRKALVSKHRVVSGVRSTANAKNINYYSQLKFCIGTTYGALLKQIFGGTVFSGEFVLCFRFSKLAPEIAFLAL